MCNANNFISSVLESFLHQSKGNICFFVLIISFGQFRAEKFFFLYPPDPDTHEDFCPDPDPQKNADPKHWKKLLQPVNSLQQGMNLSARMFNLLHR